jgi:MFS family permease
MQPIWDNRRVLTASLVGTTVEYYDFFIYGTAAALVFGPLFFPDSDPAMRTLLSFLTFGVAFLARPLGGILFGHFGDRVGRKSTLVASLLLMGFSTVAIAFLPTHAQAGWIAPALLCLLRLGQGLGLGGEWAGAALMAIENAPKTWEVRFAAAPMLGVPLGSFAATGMFLLVGAMMSDAEFAAWGWRIPFLASAVLILIGLWVRLKIEETPAFRAATDHEPPARVPFLQLMREFPGAILAACAGAIVCYAVFYMATAFALAEATGRLGYDRASFLSIQLFSNLFLIIGVLCAALLADRTSPGKTMIWGSLVIVILGFAYGPALATGSIAIATILLCGLLFVMAFTNGPLSTWTASLFPVKLRYSGVAFSMNLGGIVGGGMTPLAAQAMSAAGWGQFNGLLMSVAAVLTIIGVAMSRPLEE